LINGIAFSTVMSRPIVSKYVQVVGHDHESVDAELSGRHIGSQYVNEKHGIALRLQ
jgi:hypothetical protein